MFETLNQVERIRNRQVVVKRQNTAVPPLIKHQYTVDLIGLRSQLASQLHDIVYLLVFHTPLCHQRLDRVALAYTDYWNNQSARGSPILR